MKLKAVLLALACLTLFNCKMRDDSGSQVTSDSTKMDCREILTRPEEIQTIQYASSLAENAFKGKISAQEKDAELDAYIARYTGMKRNAIRYNIAKAQELAAAAWVLPRAISFTEESVLSKKDLNTLSIMGVDSEHAKDYLLDIKAYFSKPYKEIQKLGLELVTGKGWVLSGDGSNDSFTLSEVTKNPKAISAIMLFFGSEVTKTLLDEDRQESIFIDNHALLPANRGSVEIWTQERWERVVQHHLNLISRESEAFIKASKAANTYSNRMRGRILEWFGIERGHNGKTAPEIEMEGTYKALLSSLNALRGKMGVRKEMRDRLFTLMRTINNIDLQNIREGIQKLNNATAAAIAAPFIPLVIWAAPYAGAAALGPVWAPVIATASAKMALLPLLYAAGTSAISAGIRTANLGGSYSCNLYKQFTDNTSKALIMAPFLAAVPVVIAGGAGATPYLTNGAMCAQTSFGVLNLGLSTGVVGLMTTSGVVGLSECHSQIQKAHSAGEEGNEKLVNLHAEKAYQECVSAGIDLGFAIVTAGRLAPKAYQAIRAKSWKPLLGAGCSGLSLVKGCGDSPPSEGEELPTTEQLKLLTPKSSKLHTNISNGERYDVIRNVSLKSTASAPGHAYLRRPEAVVSMGKELAASNDRGLKMFKNADKIVLNVYTDAKANVKSIELIDGNHRFAAGLYAERIAPGKGWARIGDIPKEFVEIRVNGFNTHGQQLPRWIPLHIAERSSIPKNKWRYIPPEWGAKGPTAEIPSSISSTSSLIKPEHRGTSLLHVLRVSLERIGMN